MEGIAIDVGGVGAEGVVGDQKKAILSLRLRLRSGLRQRGRRLRRWLVGPTDVGPFRFEEALLGVVGLAFCEPTSQKRDVGHPARCGAPGTRLGRGGEMARGRPWAMRRPAEAGVGGDRECQVVARLDDREPRCCWREGDLSILPRYTE
jgi:hypothetical protein